MIEKILNGLGLYTEKQFNSVYRRFKELEGELMICKAGRVKLVFAIKASEDAKANAIKENKKLKNDYENVVAELKDFREMLKNRNHIIDCMSKDFKKLKKENEELKKEIEKLRLKIARGVKRRRR